MKRGLKATICWRYIYDIGIRYSMKRGLKVNDFNEFYGYCVYISMKRGLKADAMEIYEVRGLRAQ